MRGGSNFAISYRGMRYGRVPVLRGAVVYSLASRTQLMFLREFDAVGGVVIPRR